MHRPSEPGTSISRPQSIATPIQPNCRAARAGNSASKSAVVEKSTLPTSSGRMPLRSMIAVSNSRVAWRISSRLFPAAVVAPRTPRHGMAQSLFT